MSSAPSNSSMSGTIPSSNAPPSNPPQQIGDYLMFETVGKGSFGKVKRGVHIPTNERVAIKILNRQKLKNANMDKKIKREINILKLFRHPNICRLYEVLQTQEDIFLIMEYIDGGELYDFIVKQGQLKEDAARYVFQQIVCAIEYCHHFRVVHRDLKPENILLGQNLQVKIIDFGLSNLMRDGDFLATSCGSPNYAAPEVISGKLYCGPEVDVWSAGVVLYALLCGCLPFDEDSIPQLFAKIKKGRYEMPNHVTNGARGLLAQLLTVDPLHRATIPQVRDNAWFNLRIPTHLSFNEVLYSEQDRLPNAILRQIMELLRIQPNSVHAIRHEIAQKKNGRIYTAYCILTDAQRRRELNNYGSTVANDINNGGANGGGHNNGGHSASSLGGASSSAAGLSSSPSPTSTTGGRQTASERELNLGLVLSINPAIEALLDTGDATSNKDFYNSSTFLPVSNRSGTSLGTPNMTRNSSQLSSSMPNGGGGMSLGGGMGTMAFPSGNNHTDPSYATGAGFSLTKRGLGTPVTGQQVVGSLLSGGGGLGETGSYRNTSTLSRFSPQTRSTPNAGPTDFPRIGSVAKTTHVYNAAEAEVAFAANAGWRVGIMTNKLSNGIMSDLYDVLAALDMSWKVLSPYRIAVKYNDPPMNALGAARHLQQSGASQRNMQAKVNSTSGGSNAGSPHGALPHDGPQFSGSSLNTSQTNQHQLLASGSAPTNAVVGAAISYRSPIITLHLFRLQEKHDRGYIVDFGIKGGDQPMVAMDLIVEIYDALRKRIA